MQTDEARELFGSTLALPATDAVYVDSIEPHIAYPDDVVGEGRMDLSEYGLSLKGRPMYQAESVTAFEEKYECVTTTMQQRCLVLIREKDTSYERALVDAYLLGDPRPSPAVTDKDCGATQLGKTQLCENKLVALVGNKRQTIYHK